MPKNKDKDGNVLFYGHRDLAEMLSQDYGLTLPRIGWAQIPEMFDMDELVSYLETVDGEILDSTLRDRWAQGFLMGMLHQEMLNRKIQMYEDGELDDDDDSV